MWVCHAIRRLWEDEVVWRANPACGGVRGGFDVAVALVVWDASVGGTALVSAYAYRMCVAAESHLFRCEQRT